MRSYMAQAFEEIYGQKPDVLELSEEAISEIQKTAGHIASWDYLYGTPLPFTFECEARFDWGHILLQLEAKGGVIQNAKVYSDAMDWQLPQILEGALTGCRFSPDAMATALSKAVPQYANDLIDLLKAQDI